MVLLIAVFGGPRIHCKSSAGFFSPCMPGKHIKQLDGV